MVNKSCRKNGYTENASGFGLFPSIGYCGLMSALMGLCVVFVQASIWLASVGNSRIRYEFVMFVAVVPPVEWWVIIGIYSILWPLPLECCGVVGKNGI